MPRLLAILTGLATLLGSVMAFSGAQASTAMNEAELLQRVNRNNVGWDYIPQCSDETFWDIDDERCEDGEPDGDSYGLMNSTELLQKVREVDAGWDWVPRCGDGARWDDNDMVCEGGSG